ncbi:MAG: hypothetical protein VX465_00340, partial [Pseudomonadota bacterium]|nr:hypothetical protein [Pseudomonadota bacterium]
LGLFFPAIRDAQYFAMGVPNSTNRRILPFLHIARSKLLFIIPKGWEIFPNVGIGVSSGGAASRALSR